MKSTFTILALAAALIVPATAQAGDKKLKRPELFKQLDRNKNSRIDGAEVSALQTTFAKVPSNSPVKKIDSNKNGKLEEGEIAAFSAKYSSKLAKD